MPGVVVTPKAAVHAGHLWVRTNEVASTFDDPRAGDVIEVRDTRGRPLGRGFWNPTSRLAVRLLSRGPAEVEVDADFVARRLRAGLAWRQGLADVDPVLCRAAWSEADGLPGLVVDRYGDHLAVQILSLGFEQRRDAVLDALRDVFRPRTIVERSEASARRGEGLEPAKGLLWGREPVPFTVDAPAGPTVVDLMASQKTGLYLDQLANHAAVAALARGRRVLDCFCNQGGFALAAARGGAASVTGVDSSAAALELARVNAAASGAKAGAEATWVDANVFDHLRTLDRDRALGRYDLIVVDPPPFAPNKRALVGARRGYKELNLRALRLLEPGGLLSTYSCSHHVGPQVLADILAEAAADARRGLRIVAEHRQRADHPVLVAVPETRYLSGFTVEVIDRW